LPVRAARARAAIAMASAPQLHGRQFDLTLVDAPCSGSGTWRRAPEAKWLLDPPRLQELTALQSRILSEVVKFVPQGGYLAYMTCSVLDEENTAQIECFTAHHSGFRLCLSRRFLPSSAGDGFFLALFQRD
ncbi:MAG: RsmB/NOP family class I SAM-dependent RNA methyltransferase, partial [Paracoccaceae bacterium]